MIPFLQAGANAPLAGSKLVFQTEEPLDLILLILSEDGKVTGDSDMVFYGEGQQSGPGVKWSQDRVTIDLEALRPGAEKLILAASPADQTLTFKELPNTGTIVSVDGAESFHMVASGLTSETVLLLAEVYRRNGEWKLRAKLDGYESGLAGLASDYGIAVDDAPSSGTTTVVDAALQAPIASGAIRVTTVEDSLQLSAPPAPPASEPEVEPPLVINLKKAERISLAKLPTNAVVTANLIWDGGDAKRKKQGADLDLYTLWVDVDGNTGCVAHNNLGSLTQAPFVELVTGDSVVPGIETVKVTRPDRLRKVAFCVYQAFGNGAGALIDFQAKVVLSDGRGNEITVPLLNRSQMYWCLVGTVEFINGAPVITQVEEYDRHTTEHRPEIYSDGSVRMGKGPDESQSK